MNTTETTTATERAREILTLELGGAIGTEKAETIAAAAFADPSATKPEEMRDYLGHLVSDGELYGLADHDLPETIEPKFARAVLSKALANAYGGVAEMIERVAFGDARDARGDEAIARNLAYVFGV